MLETRETEEARTPPNGAQPVYDPFGLTPPDHPVQHRTFTDPAQPGVELVLSLQKAGTVGMARSAAEANRMARMYLTGSEEMPAGPFPLVGGKVIPVSEELFGQACLIFAMQAPPGESRQPRQWSPEHLVAWSVTMENAWPAVLRWANEIEREGRAEGNFPLPRTEF